MNDEPESRIGAQTNFSMVPNGVVKAKISDRAFRVYVCLKAYVRPGNDTFPKLITVAERFGMSESYMKRGVAELREYGLLRVEKRSYSGGFRKINCYYFPDVADIPDSDRPGGSDLTPPDGSTVTAPDGSDLLPPKEEEKQEEEKQEETPSSEVAVATSRPEVDSLCVLLADLIEGNGSKRPTITKAWRNAARLLLDSDGYNVAQVEYIIRWCQQDSFWRSNILSMPKLREKFEQLKLKVRAEAEPKTSNRPTTTDRMRATIELGQRMEQERLRGIA